MTPIVFLENTVRLMESGPRCPRSRPAIRQGISFTILAMTISLAAVLRPAGLYEGAGRAHFSRVLHHHHRFDFRQRHRFADAHALDVFRPASRARGAREEELDRARHRRRGKKGC